MKLEQPKPLYCIWNGILTLYSTYEAEGLLESDLPDELNREIEKIPVLTDKQVLEESAKAFNTDVKILQTLVCLSMLSVLDFRRFLACRELEQSVGKVCQYPQTVKHKVIAKRHGFSPETVRKFYKRYPKYFKCSNIQRLFN